MWNRKLLVEFIKLSPRIPGHKDNLYQKVLVARLPLDYFRFDFRYPSLCWLLPSPTFNNAFDFRGASESCGTSMHAGLANDVEDFTRCSCVSHPGIWLQDLFLRRSLSR